MTQLTIHLTLPEDMSERLRERASAAGHENVDDFVRAMLMEELEYERDIGEELDPETEAKLLEGLNTPAREWTRADIDERIRRYKERHAGGNQQS